MLSHLLKKQSNDIHGNYKYDFNQKTTDPHVFLELFSMLSFRHYIPDGQEGGRALEVATGGAVARGNLGLLNL